MKHLAPYVAGKTGTSDDENDVWFVGFTNDVTAAVWVGYDNADGKRRTLGAGHTGGSVAVPIFEEIIQATWAYQAPKSPLNGPSPAAKQLLAVAPGDGNGKRQAGLIEYFRRDPKAGANTRSMAVSRGTAANSRATQSVRSPSQFYGRVPQDPASPPWAFSWGSAGANWQDHRYEPRHYVEQPPFIQGRRPATEPSTYFQWR